MHGEDKDLGLSLEFDDLRDVSQPGQPAIKRGISFSLRMLKRTAVFVIPSVPSIIVLWALIHYRQPRPVDASQCSSRFTDKGFEGNADFYGLGIRLGIYMQWCSIIVSKAWFSNTSRFQAASFSALSSAMLVALFLLIFRDGCTFTVEIIVAIFFILGGTSVGSIVETGEDLNLEFNLTEFRGLEIQQCIIVMLALPIAAWFWIRMASVGEHDFVRTPGGTSMFFFAHIHGHQLLIVSKYLAFFSIWLGTYLLWAPLLYVTAKSPRAKYWQGTLLFTWFGPVLVLSIVCTLVYNLARSWVVWLFSCGSQQRRSIKQCWKMTLDPQQVQK